MKDHYVIIDEVWTPEVVEKVNQEARDRGLIDHLPQVEVDMLSLVDESIREYNKTSNALNDEFKERLNRKVDNGGMNRAQRRDHNRRHGRLSNGKPK